jgi:Glyoxalase-like domain
MRGINDIGREKGPFMRAAGSEADRQLPLREEIFLDHVGHFVRDPEAASRALARAGFAPTPMSIQVNPAPDGSARLTGTGNVTAMLARGYIEALFKTADTPLGRELETALARHAGVHLAAFAAADAAAAHRRLAAAGFRTQPLVQMQRPVDTGGPPGTAAFTLARLQPGEMPEGRIQILTHHSEAMVWQPRWLAHPNGALALTHIIVAVADPQEAADRFARFTGRAATRSASGFRIALDRGQVDLVGADAFARWLPEIAIPSLPFAGAYGIRVASLAHTEELLARAGLARRHSDQGLVATFPVELGYGAWLFTE